MSEEIIHENKEIFCEEDFFTLQSRLYMDECIKNTPYSHPKENDKNNWKDICYYAVKDDEFWQQNIDKIDWVELSCNPNVSEKFIEQNLDKIDQEYMMIFRSFSIDFCDRLFDKLKNVSYNRFYEQIDREEKFIFAICALQRRFKYTFYNPFHPRGIYRLNRTYSQIIDYC